MRFSSQSKQAQTAPRRGSYKKKPIPLAVRQQSWIRAFGLEEKHCAVTWCTNRITPFDFHCGHNIPESRGGLTVVENLIPICSRCNLSMSDTYTFDEWCKKFSKSSLDPQSPPPTIPQVPVVPPSKSGWSKLFCRF